MNKRQLQESITWYWRCKGIINMVSDGDRQDEQSIAVREALTPEELFKMTDFVNSCEDYGIHLLKRHTN